MVSKSTMDKFEIMSSLYLLIVFLIILLTAFIGNHTIFLVLVGFSPTILTIIISLLIHEQTKHHKHLLWIVPVFVLGGFFMLKDSALFITMDVEVLTGINFILSMLYVILAFSIFGTESEKVALQAIEHMVEIPKKKEEPKQDLKSYINSIEDKSKALNFAIGRVYSQYHGGSKNLREKIQISSELYNEFSLIGINEGDINLDKLSELIDHIEDKLKLLEKTEKQIFGTSSNLLKNIIRDVDGKDKIIDVLDHNDKDPVRSYYEGALDFCEKIREEMKNLEVSIIKNEYIPRSDEEKEGLKSNIVESKDNKPKKH